MQFHLLLTQTLNLILNSNFILVSIYFFQAILQADSSNYLALVIFGAALQESNSKDEATSAYRKAIGLSPDQILAWQGLASYYEKEKTTNYDDLLPVYTKLLLLEK